VRLQRETAQQKSKLLTLAEARRQALRLDWSSYVPPRPASGGLTTFAELDLAKLVDFIDWTPFLHTWRLPGRYPRILDDPEVGPEARRLMAEAEAVLQQAVSERRLRGSAVVGLFPAAAAGDDLVFFTDESRTQEMARVPFLRQQRLSRAGRPNLCLTDFVAPLDSGIPDWVGGFVVTAGLGAAEWSAENEAAGDDFMSIMVKAVADRLAEAGAEYLHAQVRRHLWGYAPAESLDNDALIAEEYRGIRPAPGYPACPDHYSKIALFRLLDAENQTGVILTESCAMDPAASVAGWYLAHPEARYFGLGKIDRDQSDDYASRAGLSPEESARWLAPNLAKEA
jgi:5-methyltetrahydrofolate--homocysteine methyltransferase